MSTDYCKHVENELKDILKKLGFEFKDVVVSELTEDGKLHDTLVAYLFVDGADEVFDEAFFVANYSKLGMDIAKMAGFIAGMYTQKRGYVACSSLR